jgi:hypothetical protein
MEHFASKDDTFELPQPALVIQFRPGTNAHRLIVEGVCVCEDLSKFVAADVGARDTIGKLDIKEIEKEHVSPATIDPAQQLVGSLL